MQMHSWNAWRIHPEKLLIIGLLRGTFDANKTRLCGISTKNENSTNAFPFDSSYHISIGNLLIISESQLTIWKKSNDQWIINNDLDKNKNAVIISSRSWKNLKWADRERQTAHIRYHKGLYNYGLLLLPWAFLTLSNKSKIIRGRNHVDLRGLKSRTLISTI